MHFILYHTDSAFPGSVETKSTKTKADRVETADMNSALASTDSIKFATLEHLGLQDSQQVRPGHPAQARLGGLRKWMDSAIAESTKLPPLVPIEANATLGKETGVLNDGLQRLSAVATRRNANLHRRGTGALQAVGAPQQPTGTGRGLWSSVLQDTVASKRGGGRGRRLWTSSSQGSRAPQAERAAESSGTATAPPPAVVAAANWMAGLVLEVLLRSILNFFVYKTNLYLLAQRSIFFSYHCTETRNLEPF